MKYLEELNAKYEWTEDDNAVDELSMTADEAELGSAG